MKRSTHVDGWRRIRLSGGGEIALLVRCDISRVSASDLLFLAGLVATCDRYEQAKRERQADRQADLSRWADDGGVP